MKQFLLAGVTVLVLAGTAYSTEDFCAVVLKPPREVTRDKGYDPNGWLALRVYPIRQSKAVAKLREGDYLLADTLKPAHCDRPNLSGCANEWMHVISVPRIDGPASDKKVSSDYTQGWVRGKYVQFFLCPEDQAAENNSGTIPGATVPVQGGKLPTVLDPPLVGGTLPTLDNPNPDTGPGHSVTPEEWKANRWPNWLGKEN